MKTQIKDQYNFQQASPSKQPGFEVFQPAPGKAWFFHGNDVDGKPALFSQPYSTAESAQRGLNSALGLLKKQRAKVQESAEGWCFVLQSGNHQELARSRFFPAREACEKMAGFFQKVANSQHPLIENAGSSNQSTEVPSPSQQELAQDNPVRHAFRLYFYPASDGKPLTGRIENIKTQEQKIFKGLDGPAIMQFLKAQVKEFAPDGTSDYGIAADHIHTLSGVLSAPANTKHQDLVELEVVANDMPGESAIEGCTLSLRHMDTQEITTLRNVHARLGAKGKVKINLDASALPIGTYHLNASVWLQNQGSGKKQAPLYHLLGTGWLQLI